MTRQRQVFPTGEIPHKWAHATQEAARNPQGNLYFKGATIYSYRDSWPLARIYSKGAPTKGGRAGNPDDYARDALLILVNCDRASVTTAGHASDVRQAIRHLPSLSAPHCDLVGFGYGVKERNRLHGLNLAYLAKEAAEHLSKAQRAMQVSNVNWRQGAARELLEGYAQYLAFFGIRRKAPAFPAAEWQLAQARAQRIENPDPASLDARERASARRAAATAEVAEYREEMVRSMRSAGHYLGYRVHVGKRWPSMIARKVGEKGTPWYHDMAQRTNWRLNLAHASYPRHDSPVMLRVSGEQIETSQGARIPLAAAPLVWAKVQRALGKGWKPSGLCAMKIGDYALDGIDADGTLRVGCHVIPHSELRSMARQLGLGAA